MAKPDPLAGEPFSYLSRSDGSIVIRYHAAPVTVLRGKTAARFSTRMAGADADAAQQLMARATGNFKRGNERRTP
ncbi:MAG: hypothetical protein ACR2I5_01190 [Candidatus Limnocylindria bacterium]